MKEVQQRMETGGIVPEDNGVPDVPSEFLSHAEVSTADGTQGEEMDSQDSEVLLQQDQQEEASADANQGQQMEEDQDSSRDNDGSTTPSKRKKLDDVYTQVGVEGRWKVLCPFSSCFYSCRQREANMTRPALHLVPG